MVMINATPPDYQVLVGTLDITPFIIAFTLRSPELDIKTPIVWQGSITLLEDGLNRLGESLDDFVNTDRWAEGKHPVKIYFSGTLVATMRIRSYIYQKEKDRNTAQIELSQLLDLCSYRTPPQTYRDINSGCFYLSIAAIISSLLSSAGLTNCDFSNLPGNLAMPAPDRVGQSYIELAQLILGERGYWLYHKPNEQVAIASRWNKLASPLFSRARSQTLDFVRVGESSLRYRLPRQYKVTGGGDLFDACQDSLYGIKNGVEIVEIYGALEDVASSYSFTYIAQDQIDNYLTRSFVRGVIERRITETVKNTPSELTKKTTTYRNLVLKDSTGKEYKYDLYKVSEVLDSQYYDSQGRLIKEVINRSSIALGEFPNTVYDLEPKARQWLDGAEVQTIEYLSDPRRSPIYQRGTLPSVDYDNNVLRLKVDRTDRYFLNTYSFRVRETSTPTVYTLTKATKQLIIETWLENCFSLAEPVYKYERLVYVSNQLYFLINSKSAYAPSELVIDQKTCKTEEDAMPPNWSTRPPLCPRRKARLNTTVEVPYPGSESGLFLDSRQFEYQAQTIASPEQAQVLARIFGDLNVGRAFGYQFALSLREATEWIANPSPIKTAWVHDRILLLENMSLAISGQGAQAEGRIAWQAAMLGKLSAPVGSPTTPVPTGIVQEVEVITAITHVRINLTPEPFGANELPDLSTITIDGNGNVLVIGDYVQASVNQNAFAQILVNSAGAITVNSDGNVVTANNPYEDSFWNSILTIDGKPVTMDGMVLQA